MLTNYYTLQDIGSASIIINKSEFIAHAKEVKTEAEALEFINSIKKKYYNATHNCYAYVIGENDQFQKANDDDEPSGTAGKPILELIKKIALKDTVVVVTRYYGGIMLGAGGLIRAYGKAAKEGILAAGVVERALYHKLHLSVDYSWYGKIENEMNNRGYTIHQAEFLDNVLLTILAADGEEEALQKLLVNITNGQAAVSLGESIYVDSPVQLDD